VKANYDPELEIQEPTDRLSQLLLMVLTAWIILTDYLPAILLGVIYAVITTATAIIIIHHITQ
jgi:hypothetical protein